jgi:hypothetical protein
MAGRSLPQGIWCAQSGGIGHLWSEITTAWRSDLRGVENRMNSERVSGASNGGPPSAWPHPQTSPIHTTPSRCNTRPPNPHSPASLPQLASSMHHQGTSFQHGVRSSQHEASPAHHPETSFQHTVRALRHDETPLGHQERLRVVASRSRGVATAPGDKLTSSRVEAKTPAHVASWLGEALVSPADGRDRAVRCSSPAPRRSLNPFVVVDWVRAEGTATGVAVH